MGTCAHWTEAVARLEGCSRACRLECGGKYPRAVALAHQIDKLSEVTILHLRARDLNAFLETLRGAHWLLDEHFVDFERPPQHGDPRDWLDEAGTWEECKRPAAVLICNLLFDLLAVLDLEFCSSYLTSFEATPIFLSVMPKVRTASPRQSRVRDKYHLPVRRLLTLSACLRYWKQHRRWPRSAPTVKDASIWMKVSPEALTKWRTGRQFTFNDYAWVWDNLFENLELGSRPAIPTPLLFATTMFTQLYVIGSAERGDLSVRHPEPAYYLKWWALERKRIGEELDFGSRPWMPDFC
jgi:hypothetical protein